MKSHLQLCQLAALSYDGYSISIGNSAALVEIVDGIQYIAFAGSDDAKDWRFDLDAKQVPWSSKDDAKPYGGSVHRGFKTCWEEVKPHLLPKLDLSLPTVVTGHSLGGALAVLCAASLKRVGVQINGVATFGCPMVFDVVGSNGWLNLGLPTVQYANDTDGVTEQPGSGRGFVGLVDETVLDGKGRIAHKSVASWWMFWKRISGDGAHKIAQYLKRLRPMNLD